MFIGSASIRCRKGLGFLEDQGRAIQRQCPGPGLDAKQFDRARSINVALAHDRSGSKVAGRRTITGCIFGLNFANPKAVEFFDRMVALSQDGVTFPGPWKNDGGSCSSNAGVLGHRHDQTAMSVLRHQMGMEWRHSEHPWMCYAGPGVAEKETTLLINT